MRWSFRVRVDLRLFLLSEFLKFSAVPKPTLPRKPAKTKLGYNILKVHLRNNLYTTLRVRRLLLMFFGSPPNFVSIALHSEVI